MLTFVFHIPHNNALTLIDPAGPGAADAWHDFFVQWTAGNHVRTMTSLAGAVSFIIALRVG